MSRVTRTTTLALAATAALSGAASAPAQVPEDDPRLRLVVRVEDRYLRAPSKSYCLRNDQGSGCLDANVRVRRLPRIRVAPGGAIELRPTVPASEVRVIVGRPGPRHIGLPIELQTVRARQSSADGTRWRARLPRRRFTYVRILVRYGAPQEYVDFFLGIRTARACSVPRPG